MKNNQVRFNGKECCIFHGEVTLEKIRGLKFIKDYGDTYYDEDGNEVHYLHSWDDGHRALLKCPNCGALFLYQISEYHGFYDGDDDYYKDFYQVESEEVAEYLNAIYSGDNIKNYEAPTILVNNLKINAFLPK